MDNEVENFSRTDLEQKWFDISQPEPYVVKMAELLESGSILDLGVYNGRHALYLAERGFKVTAVDTSAQNLAIMEPDFRQAGIATVQCDVREYEPSQQFDGVLAGMLLHFLPAEDVQPTITNLQHWTNPGGYNFVSAYTKEMNPPDKRPYLFTAGELEGYYRQWEIIDFEEKLTPWVAMSGADKGQKSHGVWLLARKRQE